MQARIQVHLRMLSVYVKFETSNNKTQNTQKHINTIQSVRKIRPLTKRGKIRSEKMVQCLGDAEKKKTHYGVVSFHIKAR